MYVMYLIFGTLIALFYILNCTKKKTRKEKVLYFVTFFVLLQNVPRVGAD